MTLVDHRLREWATEREKQYLDAILKHGSVRQASMALGVSRGTVQSALRNLQKRAALKGYSPEHDMTRTVPDGFKVKGVSTYYNKEGKPSGQWVKSSEDAERREQIVQAALVALGDQVPRAKPINAPRRTLDHLCNLYVMTDCHYGMLAWHREGGADWDLRIAEGVLGGCFDLMVDSAPPARVGVVAQLGDWLHFDSLSAVTPTSGHVLDADGRFTKVVEGAVRVLRNLVDKALTKHSEVVVLMAEGNHDVASSVWLRVMFKALYELEPRVTVIDSALPYYVHQHGETMLAFHHGHLKKNDQLPGLFAAQFPKVWGSTVKRYAHTGHRHHVEEREHPGMTVVQHPTLSARDAYAARGGWISERQAQAITYHVKHGKVGTTVVTPEMLEG